MKKSIKIFIVMMLVVVGLTAFSGCNLIKGLLGDDEETNEVFVLGGSESVTIKIGDVYEVTLDETSVQEKFTLSSTDETGTYISIDNDKSTITGVKKTDDPIVVTATSESGKTDTLNVTVKNQDLSKIDIEITNEVDQYQLLTEAEEPQEVKFGVKINTGASIEGKTITWTLLDSNGTKVEEKTCTTYAYTPVKDVNYTLTAKVDKVTSEVFKFGAFGLVHIEANEEIKYGDDLNITIEFVDENISGTTTSFEVFVNNVSIGNANNVAFEKVEGNRYTAGIRKTNNKTIGTFTIKVVYDGVESNTLTITVDYADISEVTINNTSATNLVQILSIDTDPSTLTFDVSVNEGATLNKKTITWTLLNITDGVNVETKKGSTYSFTPDRQTSYSLSATVDEVSSTPVIFSAYDKIHISGLSNIIIGEDVEIDVVLYSESDISGVQQIDIYENSVNKGIGTTAVTSLGNKKYSGKITLPAYISSGEYSVYAMFDGEKSNTIEYAVDTDVCANRIVVQEPSDLMQTTAQAVTFTASLEPINADTSKINWYINGVKQSQTGNTFTYTPKNEGEYHVQAKLDNLSSRIHTIVYVKTTSDTYSYANELTHKYGGYKQNRYITNAEELKNIILYAVENQLYGSDSDTLNIYMGYNYQASVVLDAGTADTDVEKFKQAISNARDLSEESGILPGFGITYTNGNAYEYGVYFDYTINKSVAIVNSPSKEPANTQTDTTQSTASKPHYTSGSAHTFYIDSATETMKVTTSNMLYKAVQWGYKPEFNADANGAKLEGIYNNAKDALTKIITDEMTDLQKVHAIYDWIIYNVRYDYDCSSATTSYSDTRLDLNEKMNYYAYYLEGIFLDTFYNTNNMHAVCDGRSKAFVLLCAIEGIDAVRIAGTADTTGEGWTVTNTPATDKKNGYTIYVKVNNNYVVYSGSTFSSGTYYINRYAGGHAWNKVLLDVGSDENKEEWFFVDTTWGDSGNPVESLNHAYFLLSDNEVSNTHAQYSGRNYPEANSMYDYYANELVPGKTQSYNVTAENATAQLTEIIKYAMANGITNIEFESPYEYNLTDKSSDFYKMVSGALSAAKYYGSYGCSNPARNVIVLTIS